VSNLQTELDNTNNELAAKADQLNDALFDLSQKEYEIDSARTEGMVKEEALQTKLRDMSAQLSAKDSGLA
jgi:hypothetical protein